MAIECAFSFADLFRAAQNREPTEQELVALYALPQDLRNEKVQRWAQTAGWETRARVGTDGQTYLAFAPKFNQ